MCLQTTLDFLTSINYIYLKVKSALLTAIALVVLLGGGTIDSQELSTEIFPSEDEIYQALRSGEITYRQYLILQEIAAYGLDSSTIHLLDEIPNLTFFAKDSNSMATSLETEQQTPFMADQKKSVRTRQINGAITHRYYRFAEEDGRSKYGTSARVNLGDNVVADIKLRREYSGRERIISRTVKYRSKRGILRELLVGNFSKRLGMGSVIGYRGKLFSYSSTLDSESLLFPDNGGFNGVSAHLSNNGWQVHVLGSVNRSDDYRLTTTGGMIQQDALPLKPSLLFAANRLRNRATGKAITDIKYGLNGRYEYNGGYSGFEVSGQEGERSSFGAFITEGRHRFNKAEIKYAGWTYGDNYIDLSGGSKAGGLSHKDRLESVEFEYTTKRAGQSGGLVKTIIQLNRGMELAKSVLYASFNSDTTDIQWLAEITKKLDRLSLGLSFLSRTKDRTGQSSTKRQTKLVAKFKTQKLYFKTHVGYNTSLAERDFISTLIGIANDFCGPFLYSTGITLHRRKPIHR